MDMLCITVCLTQWEPNCRWRFFRTALL